MKTDSPTGIRAIRVPLLASALLAGCLVLTALPINAFDCMDGHPVTRCSALRMYFGWTRSRPAGTSLYTEAQCGDFGW